jgi:hypothetical protein
LRAGTEPAEVRQAIEQVRLTIEQHGESRLSWRKGSGIEREWWIPSDMEGRDSRGLGSGVCRQEAQQPEDASDADDGKPQCAAH